MKLLNTLRKSRYKAFSRASKLYGRLRERTAVLAIQAVARAMNMLAGTRRLNIRKEAFHTRSTESVDITLLGYIGADGDLKNYKRSLDSADWFLKNGDISLASLGQGKNRSSIRNLLGDFGVRDVRPGGDDFYGGVLYESGKTAVGVISYTRYSPKARKAHVTVELMRLIYALRHMGADYIIIYVIDRGKKGREIGKREKRLFGRLAQMGGDYIFGVTPNVRSGGLTYMRRGRRVSRSVFSAGTFLAANKNLSNRRIAVCLRLKRVNGALTAYDESYIPLYHTPGAGFSSLVEKNTTRLDDSLRRKYLAQLETEMGRLCPINRKLTVGGMMYIMGEKLPEKYTYLKDFVVGKVCARTFECKPGDVFFFREPFADPNDRVPVSHRRRVRAARRAAKNALAVFSFCTYRSKAPLIVMDNVMEAHIRVCAYLRQRFQLKCIGITGSVGKTSTKDMLAEVLKMQYNTVKSERNSNVQVKIGLNIQTLKSDCDVYIQEIGGGRPGGASRHARMVLPCATVVTNIGDAHIGNFHGDKTALMKNKLGITEGMTPDGTLYLNGDDPLLAAAKPGCNCVYYAVQNKNADYYADEIIELPHATDFYVVHGEERHKVTINVLGQFNVLNAVCCFAIGRQFGIAPHKIARGLAEFKPSGIRQNVVQVCGMKLFMDCYNASSASMDSSMGVLSAISVTGNHKRIAVIGDITGSGELEEDVHRNVAKTVMKYPIDRIILFGASVRTTWEMLRESGVEAEYTDSREKLNSLLREWAEPGDAILFKGSSKVLLERSADMVFGTRFTDQRFIDEVEYRRVKSHGLSYNMFGDYATALRAEAGKHMSNVKVPRSVFGVPVENIGPRFGTADMKSVQMAGGVRHFGQQSFAGCRSLERIKIPGSLKFIGNAAFKDCTSLESLDLPEGLLHIGNDAFAGCRSLSSLYLPSSVSQIGRRAFAGCDRLTLYCRPGTYAEQYLKKQKINFICR